MGKWKSIMQEEDDVCFLCGQRGTECHHCLQAANRRKCEHDGLYVRLCRDCHNEVHFGKNGAKNIFLKTLAQDKYEETHTREEFMARYGRSYR